MFGERALRTPLYASTEAPPDMLAVDQAVCRIELPERRLIIERYQWRVPWWLAARRNGWSKSKYYRTVEAAEWSVHVHLQK